MILRIGRPRRLKSRRFAPPFLNIGKLVAIKRRGFTFIEIVLVTIIILVLVGLSTPLFRGSFTNIQLRTTTQNLVQLVRYMQAKAIAERRICRINFDFEKASFWPTVQDDVSPLKLKRIAGKWGRTFKAPQDISISAEAPFINFYPDGSIDEARIELSGRKGKAAVITTSLGIGYVKVEE